ncbi:hypothetical protein FA15DRAFT_760384 [Coprinopsis marcescibilis]|uniref:Nephrocystin 3-like N-terminal domain-containing protein n=1 Tax=Coprinopsis marcescibilis TaxID=230819 RepID=A0A5C3KGR6_COPMA|nr:hypothetical protein FA15DRAFT_760384 [Coprinopsis marcescibilis]
MSAFSKARNVTLTDSAVTSTVLTIHNSTHVNQSASNVVADGMKILFDHIAPDAIHDSSARFDAPRCSEGTREGVQDDIMTWTYGLPDVGHDLTLLLWMYGAAGAGKSAIQQSIAERGASERILAASFFFSHQDPERDNPGKLFPTLAYQLAVKIPDLQPYIAHAVISDVSIFTKSAEVQMEALILDPISRATQANPASVEAWPKLVVIDGLDECKHTYPRPVNPLPEEEDDQGESQQLLILTLLHNNIASRRLPFRVVLASRPDQPMRGYFSPEGHAGAVTRQIILDDRYKPAVDIRKYLGLAFTTIRTRHQLPPNWPPEDVIDDIVDRSSGQFIYASTVIRFVGGRPTSRPRENLQFILDANTSSSPSGSTNPYSRLDAMYRAILKACPDPQDSILCLKFSLHISWRSGSDGNFNRFTASKIDSFLQLDAYESTKIFGSLHSLVSVPERNEADTKSYGVYHKSLMDFLNNVRRCGEDLYIPDEAVAAKISIQLLRTSSMISECVSPTSCDNVIHGAKLCTSDITFLHEGDYSYNYIHCPIPWWGSLGGTPLLGYADIVKAELDRVGPDVWLAPKVKARTDELVQLYVWVHCVPFGCGYLRCSNTCRRWRQAIRTQLTLAGVKLPNAAWRLLSALAPPRTKTSYLSPYEAIWRMRGCFQHNWRNLYNQ